MTPKKADYVCIREKQVNKHEVDIANLKAKSEFKDEVITGIKLDIEKMDKKLDKIDGCLTDLQRQSERDDFNIDNRVTKLENTQNVLKWILGIGLSVVATAIAVLTFFITMIPPH